MLPAMSFLDQCLALARWKRMILLNTLVVAGLAVVVALILPKWYRSTASVFPPEDEGMPLTGLSNLVSVANAGMVGRSSLPVLASPSDLFVAVLESRTVGEEVIRRHDLQRVFHAKDMDSALKALKERVRFKVGNEGVVKVSATDKDPARAAAMANTFVELLDRVNREKRHTSARQARVFIEGRLEENRRDLAAAEDTLRAIQERTGVLIPDEQFKALIGAASEVQVQLALKEVDLAVLRAQVGVGSPDLRALEREVQALRGRLRELEVAPFDASAGDAAGVQRTPVRPGPLELPLNDYPGLTVGYLRAMREVHVQEAVFELLTQQYEQYRIQESRDTPTVQVLDPGVPATRKVKPIRWLICVSATALAFLASLTMAALLEAGGRLRRENPAAFERVRALAGEFGMARMLDRL